jgi:hypothetical protein
MGIGTLTPSRSLDIAYGSMNVSTATSTIIYSTAGSYTVAVPFNVKGISFEMIGAGGPALTGSGGTGGYMTGKIQFPEGTTSIKVVVGAVGSAGTNPAPGSGASYINIPGTTLFAMTGAGGGGSSTGTGGGGGGGLGTFSAGGVSPGANNSNNCTNSGGSKAGDTTGGLGYIPIASCTAFPTLNGQSYPGTLGLYENALGGTSGFFVPGGNGYAGGGGGDFSGGGGSSYYNATYTLLINSLAGASVTTQLSPYGRSNTQGYVSITFEYASVFTNGDIYCRSLLTTSSLFTENMTTSTMNVFSLISSPNGRILLGTGTPSYRLEINNGGEVLTNFNTGFRYTSTGQISNVATPINNVEIQMKTQFGIWASVFFATSDKRIKKNIVSIVNNNAMEVIRQIKPVSYRYIDEINRNKQEYGFIAQEVQPVLPYSVQKGKDFIPNIYSLADISTLTESTSILVLRSESTPEVEKGDIVRIFDLRERPLEVEVCDKGISSIVVKGDLLHDVSNKILTEEDNSNHVQENTVFVYGKRIEDLNVLDKDAIFSVGIAAIKEMDQALLQQENTLEGQRQRIINLQKKYEERQAK